MTIEFPDVEQWFPSIDALNDIGQGLLDVCVAALALFPGERPGTNRAERYERTFVGHGTEATVVPSKAKQLTVVCPQLFIGRAGEQQYQFPKGEPGKFGFQTAQFQVEASAPWPAPVQQGTKTLTPTPAYDEARAGLWRDGYIVWAALLALTLGGVERPWDPGGSVQADEMALGPLLAKDPKGPAASWVCSVHVQMA